MLKGYLPNHYYLMIVKQNQKNVTEITKERLQEQAEIVTDIVLEEKRQKTKRIW